MTNEEAIEELKGLQEFINGTRLNGEIRVEAFDLAIKALEKPQGDIHDLISREALRNVILNDRKLDGANANWEVNRILVHIENAPTVEEKPFEINVFLENADESTLFDIKKELARVLTDRAEREAYEEARREAMRLDDNEDTAKWRGTH